MVEAATVIDLLGANGVGQLVKTLADARNIAPKSPSTIHATVDAIFFEIFAQLLNNKIL